MRTRPLFPLLGGCVVFALSALLAAGLFGPYLYPDLGRQPYLD